MRPTTRASWDQVSFSRDSPRSLNIPFTIPHADYMRPQAASPTEHSSLPNPLDTIGLTPLMQRTTGSEEVLVGLLDGPVATDHPELADATLTTPTGEPYAGSSRKDSAACIHGTYVAGMLCARRGTETPAICPGCPLLVRPIFTEPAADIGKMPSINSEELAAAIVEAVESGAWVINLSAAFDQPSLRNERRLVEALDHAAARRVIVVVAAGNQGTLGSSAVTRHPWAIPVVSCGSRGRPTAGSNLGASSGRGGVMAPGEEVTSLKATGGFLTLAGTSVAVPFVTGAIALLWSVFPKAEATQMKLAVTAAGRRRRALVPPLLDAWTAYQRLARELHLTRRR